MIWHNIKVVTDIVLLLMQRCHILWSPRQYCLIPPSTPLSLALWEVCTLRERLPIHTVFVWWHSPHGSTCAASTILDPSAKVMAFGLQIHRSFFSVGNNTGPTLPTNLLVMDVHRWGEGILFLFWGFNLLWFLLLQETVFLDGVFLLCCHPFWFFSWLLHGGLSFFFILCLDFLWVTSSISHFLFLIPFRSAICNRGGGGGGVGYNSCKPK